MRWVKCTPEMTSGPMPQARSGHTAAVIGGRLMVIFGGLFERTFLGDVVVLDTTTMQWSRPLGHSVVAEEGAPEDQNIETDAATEASASKGPQVASASSNATSTAATSGTSGGGAKPTPAILSADVRALQPQSASQGPCPRAFHSCVVVDRLMYIFGGRFGRNRLGDLWVLDTATWRWQEITTQGSLPRAREFAASALLGGGRILLHGGFDGEKLLADVHILDTATMTWSEHRVPPVSGYPPSARKGHVAIMLERRLLMFGGTTAMNSLNDLWALKGLYGEEPLSWAKLQLSGTVPAARGGHSTVMLGPRLLFFGGHGTTGWLSRYPIYFNDCTILDRESVTWNKLVPDGGPPAPRAYHTMAAITCPPVVLPRLLLFGGFDGKTSFGDAWWLLADDDPLREGTLPKPLSTEWGEMDTLSSSSMSPPAADSPSTAVFSQRAGSGRHPASGAATSTAGRAGAGGATPSAPGGAKGPEVPELPRLRPSAEAKQLAAQRLGNPHSVTCRESGVTYSSLLQAISQRLLSSEPRAASRGNGASRDTCDWEAMDVARAYLSLCDGNSLSLRDLPALLSDYNCLAGSLGCVGPKIFS
eukprot:jgi/Mesvir1/18076/Mv09382-RA.2